MSNPEHSAAAHRSFRCTFGPVRERDLVWPPADEDIDAFSIVHLDGSDAAPHVEPTPTAVAGAETGAETGAPDVARPSASQADVAGSEAPPVTVRPQPRRRIKPTFGDCRGPGAGPRIRPLVVPMEPPPLPDTAGASESQLIPPGGAMTADATEMMTADAADLQPPPLPMSSVSEAGDPERVGAGRSAWLAVFFAAACALVTFVEYRALSGVDASEAPPVPPEVSVAEVPAPVAQAPQPSSPPATPTVEPDEPAARTPAPSPEPAAVPAPATRLALATPKRDVASKRDSGRPAREVVTPKRDVVPAPPTASRIPPTAPPRVTVDVHDRGPEPPAVAAAARVVPPPPRTAPTPAPSPAPPTGPEPLATAAPTPPVAAAVLADTANDEADIRSTLTRFRTAYSQLNAGAARDVWPTVDRRALERAFQSLKSQDLRFESCKMTVTGARAQAACTGKTVYVPRIGDQSPRFTTREWNFELRKSDERWTIASARSL